MSCRFWFEDNIGKNGEEVEICKATKEKVTCSGTREQCNFPNLFEPVKCNGNCQNCKKSQDNEVCPHWSWHYGMGELVQSCSKYSKPNDVKKCTCNGYLKNCNFKKEERMSKEKTQETKVAKRLTELKYTYKNLGAKIEQLQNTIQQLAKQKISINGGIIELETLLKKPEPKKTDDN